MTPRDALQQARAAVAKIRAIESAGERLLDESPNDESPAAAERAIEWAFAVAEAGSSLADAFAVLDSVCRLQEVEAPRPWWRFWS